MITGAGRGIGRAEALSMAAQGARVVVNNRHAQSRGAGPAANPADAVVAEIRALGGTAVASYADVSTSDGAEQAVKTAIEHFGRVDVLVNNAGLSRDRMVFNMTDDEWDSVVKVHLYGTFFCTRCASAIMRQQKHGRIINTSSHSGLGIMGQANYAAAKEGIVGFTRSAARDLGRYGITVNAIRPWAGTRLSLNEPMKNTWIRLWGEEAAERHIRELETVYRPEEVASLVTYLASDGAANINGSVFEVWRGHIGLYAEPPPIAGVLWKDGGWTPEELALAMPDTLARGLSADLGHSAFTGPGALGT